MNASVGLKKIEIEDCMELCSEFKYLATSHFEGAQDDLISVSFVQIERESPEYKKVDAEINFVFNNFFFICNPPTITALLELVTKL